MSRFFHHVKILFLIVLTFMTANAVFYKRLLALDSQGISIHYEAVIINGISWGITALPMGSLKIKQFININFKVFLREFIQSQEIIRGSPRYVGLSSSWSWVKYQEIIIHILINLHYSCLICTPVTIVGS